jgi:uncharacterized protein YbcI
MAAMAEQIALAASAFEKRRTGHVPKSVNVILNGDTLVITLHGALSPAERDTARSPAAAAQMKEYHRQLFDSSAESLRQDIKKITGADVREASAEIETISGAVMQMFASGTIVQVFLLTRGVAADTWGGSGSGKSP